MSALLSSLVGLGSGILASMGLGGGFILLVYLILTADDEQTSSQGTNLLFFLPVIAVSVALHIKNKLIDVKTALICAAFGIAAVVAGFFIARALGGDLLRKLFAVFIIIVGAKDLFAKEKK